MMWAYYSRFPGREAGDWVVAETFLVFAMVISSALVAAPSQYAAAALNRPLVDPWLVLADRILGVDVPALVRWTASRSVLTYLLYVAYKSFLSQLLLVC
jgi:hypothetical protein